MPFSFPVTGSCGLTASLPVVPDDAVRVPQRRREQGLCRVIAVSLLPQFHRLGPVRAAAGCSNRGQSAGAAEQSGSWFGGHRARPWAAPARPIQARWLGHRRPDAHPALRRGRGAHGNRGPLAAHEAPGAEQPTAGREGPAGCGKTPQAAQKGPDARRRPTAAREAYSAWRAEPEAR